MKKVNKMEHKPRNNRVIVIGAGPVGLAAAAHLHARGLKPVVLERGASAGHALSEWGHVRVFTPWQYVTDRAVVKLLEKSGWTHPDKAHLPTGKEIVDAYLRPAAATPELRDAITYNATVTAVSKSGLSKSSSEGRNDTPFTVHYRTADGGHQVMEAGAVIDASGTWYKPNPIGADGLPVPGEAAVADAISYGIPDMLGKDRAHYEGKKTLVLGGGHSAINVVLDILHLKDQNTDTRLVWGLRRDNLEKLLGGGLNDQLPARGALGLAAKKAIDEGALSLLAPMHIRNIARAESGLHVRIEVDGERQDLQVDRIVVAAGFRPDLDMLRELRLDLDEIVEAPTRLAPMIDPNLHSCGTVRPHGVDELSHPDKNFFIAGMKAYGRAPTFLMLTGYEQVRSIADELAGNHDLARRIELDLPETGVCSSTPQTSVSAGEQVQVGTSACCGVPETVPGGCCSTSETRQTASGD